ncbi:MAG: MBOAT family protein [Gemmataceae bacterium]|nr:MBOAT family protein [Gemmataceae bacterium]
MLFNSFVFLFAFLPITYVVFWLMRSAGPRYVWLTITGYVFYGYWNPWFCLLMLFSTLVSYLAGLGFLRWSGPAARRACLIIPITVDLLLLGFFKYANFLTETAGGVVEFLGWSWRPPRLDIILPVGISFYTFHTISYIVDAYRGTIKPTRNFFEFAAYVSLFSQLVAGPIVRFRQIEEDLENLGHADRTRWMSIGASFFMFGMVEKVLVADSLAFYVDHWLRHYDTLSTLGAWMAMLGYTFQLYFDFSGYSTMAVGLGYLFGLRIPINFNSPYKSLDPSDFWQRWHISLSTCLRDYVYIPLGGNRGGTFNTYRNLLLTMLIGGLWHGANWVFIVWGAYHGVLLCLHRLFGRWWDALPAILRQLGFFVLVVIGWVFFRAGSVTHESIGAADAPTSADSWTMAWSLLERMFVFTEGTLGQRPYLFGAFLVLAAWWSMAGPNVYDVHRDQPDRKLDELHLGFRWTLRHTIVYALAFGMCLAVLAGGRDSPFLYFQF